MHETIVNAATEILISIFQDAGWKCDQQKEEILREAVDRFMTKSCAITADGINNWSYAVISQRIMDKHRKKEPWPETDMGRQLWEMEEELQEVFDELGMSDYKAAYFSIILSKKTLMITEKLAAYAMTGHNTPAKRFKREEKNLKYSKDFGYSPKIVASVVLDHR